jgi:hypothetical protein
VKIATKNKAKINTPIFGKEPETEEEFYTLGNSLVVWAEKEDSINIDEFPLSLRILPEQLKEFAKKSDYFTRALKIALHIIGTRRERLAMQGTINQRIVLATMPLYDSEYRKWLLNLKHNPETESEPTTWNIYMKDYSTGESRLINSYTVPPK